MSMAMHLEPCNSFFLMYSTCRPLASATTAEICGCGIRHSINLFRALINRLLFRPNSLFSATFSVTFSATSLKALIPLSVSA